jgi:CheY-like chemotaxis protein
LHLQVVNQIWVGNYIKKNMQINNSIKKMTKPLNILLAEDDLDDQIFFKNVLLELPISTNLTTFKDGEQLMKYLIKNSSNVSSTDILFLDLSMPHKTGYECLIEIKENTKLKELQVVMFTCSFTNGIDFEQNMINTLTRMGAVGFIRKPGSFEELKNLIETTLYRLMDKNAL